MPRQTRDLFLVVLKGGSAIGLDGEVTMQQTIIDNYEKEILTMAKNRSIKVISQSGSSYKATPTLTLKGQWLKVLGVEGLRVVLDGLHCRIVNLHAPSGERATNK